MKLFHESDTYRAYLEASESMLLDDDWRPLSEYVYDRRYVNVAALNPTHLYRRMIARGGRYESSQWWTPSEKEVSVMSLAWMTVTHWKPLPDGIDAYNPLAHWEELTGHAYRDPNVREPEPEYEPAPPTERLIPSARELLVAMRDGAVLRERGREWASFTLTRPGAAPEKITYRPMRPLVQSAFIVLDGALPPRKDRWYDIPWKITDAGQAWLAANVSPARCA
ncbi:hypothetical protein M2171_002562 [Bradyrhizobium japonicum USDA 38]|uniref:hypothetical protein n=1 Tax=Bradyrhizobium japonicum TaxID=375 RepID=UPI00041809EC|nr:hypothetical protein [Bradyrhizobium japonicum]MCS3893429.1 hypothetical protein [Bradyrhizobium japonicum USDA 38]MCS3945943.1 hypothetical protein [Bradyrhizobium japonicum]